MKVFFILFLLSFDIFAGDLRLQEFNWSLTDVARKGLRKEILFSRMDRDFIKLGSSICSNRALMWAHEFKENYNLNTGKIFLFYTKKKKGKISLKTWWYHVAPVINERGSLWVMDGGFPDYIVGPLSKEEWLYKFAASKNCKEIGPHENELVELIFQEQTFPHRTPYGYYDCYYKVAPHTFWTPDILAQNILGKNSEGVPVRIERPGIDQEELYKSCLEATTSKVGYALGSNKKECKEYAGIRD